MTLTEPPLARIVVAAAVIERDNAFLVTRRLQDVHLAGYWEFPGGKCEAGESIQDCLARELREELDVEVFVGDEIFSVVHHYQDRSVQLHFHSCQLLGAPSAALGQDMRWVRREELVALPFPPADAELIELLQRAGG